ncbi:arf-GAP with SH3 domain, ANK repeat and PH domain-containing protein 2-like [Myiozetetes cayanensis]|uniref:arf-GAP with SH3 domain, ANK repeat and PH domain-containing protein 2-like n=1 Tax=Myiozetetes cayanensis TaxID=478635 RepID=UPI00215E8AC9|nr:arf-GAP with SH3 domain, ANK repeat and PH domain-containing protein 2-like [Myiozetetes cayanensis]
MKELSEQETQEGFSSPTSSAFSSHTGCCKATANSLQEVSRNSLNKFTERLIPELQSIKVRQDEAKQQLCCRRHQLEMASQLEQREDPGKRQAGHNVHQLQGNKQNGTERSGTLLKKSHGLRKVWQKRKCTISNGYLTISHSMLSRPPAQLNLLTCQLKPNVDDKKCFDLVSHNRTFRFRAEDEQDCVIWVSILSNSKEGALNVAFSKAQGGGQSSHEELSRAIIEELRAVPGNRECCDCSAPDPSWVSVNLGILICRECSGVHREMGVHLSRVQSLSLHKLATSELLLARNIGNSGFNSVMEANLHNLSWKPTLHSDMASRKNFIISKYVEKKYAKKSPPVRFSTLPGAVKNKDMLSLLQAYAQNMDLGEPVLAPLQEPGETILHLAVLLSVQTSLHIVDFLVQNSRSLARQTAEGNTALHYCRSHNRPECATLLLRAGASIAITNRAGETALDVARRMRHPLCEKLLLQAQSNQFNPHVEHEWWLGQDDMFESDEDLDEKMGPEKRGSARSQSCYHPPAAVPRPEAAEAAPQDGWPDTCPSPAAHLHGLEVPLPPSHPPPPPPQQAKPGTLTALDPLCTSGPSKVEQPGSHQALQEPDPCSGHAWDVPRPQRSSLKRRPLCRVRALYDCDADREDELTFHTGEVLVVSGKEDSNWWKGWIEGQPQRQGVFPASFVHVLSE